MLDDSPNVVNDREVAPGETAWVLETGIIGHENRDNAYDIGKNGGPILAFVQLLRGKDPTVPLKDARMQGTEIVARVRSGLSSLPPKGTEVLIAFPGGMSTKAGAGIIIAELSRADDKATYGNIAEGEMCLHPGDADNASRVIFKNDKSIYLYTTNDGTPTGKGVYLRIAPTALEFYAPWGRLVFDASGFHAVTASGARLDLGGIGGLPGPLSALSSYATLSAASVKAEGSVVFLGAGSAYDSVIHGLSGLAGIASSGVFVSV